MAYQPAHIDAVLAAALGDDPMLMEDLRQAFLHSADEHIRALTQSASVSEWHMAAWRFKGLCATFGLTALTGLAERATEAPQGDPGLLRKIRNAMAALAAEA